LHHQYQQLVASFLLADACLHCSCWEHMLISYTHLHPKPTSCAAFACKPSCARASFPPLFPPLETHDHHTGAAHAWPSRIRCRPCSISPLSACIHPQCTLKLQNYRIHHSVSHSASAANCGATARGSRRLCAGSAMKRGHALSLAAARHPTNRVGWFTVRSACSNESQLIQRAGDCQKLDGVWAAAGTPESGAKMVSGQQRQERQQDKQSVEPSRVCSTSVRK